MRIVQTAIIVLLTASCTADVDRLQIVADFERYKNAHDTEQALTLFATDAELDFGPMGKLVGHEAIRRIEGYDTALATRLALDACAVEDKDVVCRITVTNRWLAIAGIEPITYEEARFAIDDSGKIVAVAAVPPPASQAAMDQVMAAFAEWAQQHEGERFAALFDAQGNFQFSYDNGEKVLQLLREWQDAGG